MRSEFYGVGQLAGDLVAAGALQPLAEITGIPAPERGGFEETTLHEALAFLLAKSVAEDREVSVTLAQAPLIKVIDYSCEGAQFKGGGEQPLTVLLKATFRSAPPP